MNFPKLKILHTSDWHLGRSLYDHKRYEEFEKFLDWLAEFIQEQRIDVLLVAGDIFDTTTPGNRAQELYYQFLTKVSLTCCRHMVITGGNHDSPSFLNAPKDLLRYFNVHVIGAITDSLEDEVVVLYDKYTTPEAIICAVPYLRDKDIRTVELGEKMEDKNSKLISGISEHYEAVGKIAVARRNGIKHLPIIGMGHLFATGGSITEGDGVRELYVGGEARVNVNAFPECFDYLALGHLHSAQKVGESDVKRYCGSPIPMSFGESGQNKKVILVEFDQGSPEVTEHSIPCFKELRRITGNTGEICLKLEELKSEGSSAWLEIEYTGSESFSALNDLVYEIIAGTELEALRIKNKIQSVKGIERIGDQETLDDLNPQEVFNRCLDANEVAEPGRTMLVHAYEEIVNGMVGDDINAE